jgi:Ni/Fe-hydrogenase subunit HybB-like protein
MVQTPLVILGVIVSVVHQSALGMFYVLVPGKLHPLWYTSLLPVLFFVSAIAAGLAMTIFESTMSARHFNHSLPRPLILALGRALMIVLVVYGVLRVQDLIRHNAWQFALSTSYEATMFWVEMSFTLLLPIGLLAVRSIREKPMMLYAVSILTVSGFIVNRLNVALTGMEWSAGARYVPKWTEVSITLMLLSIGIALFALAVKHLPIFHHEEPVARRPVVRGHPLPAGVR